MQVSHLCIGGGGIGDESAWSAAILAQAGDQLGGVAVKVVGHVSEANLTAVQVLEGHVDRLHGRLKRLSVRLTARTRPVGSISTTLQPLSE